MAKTPKPDPARLDRLRRDWQNAAAANSRAQEEINEMMKAKNNIDLEIRTMTENVHQNRTVMGSSDLGKRVAAKREEQAAIAARVAEKRLDAEPLAEKAKAAGALYRNCAQFVGVDLYA